MKKQEKLSLDLQKDTRKYTQEATLTKKVKELLEANGIFFYKASDRYQSGVSDILCCVNGIFVALELKAKNGKPSPHQKLFIKQVIKAGGVAGICYCIKDVKDLINGAVELGRNNKEQ